MVLQLTYLMLLLFIKMQILYQASAEHNYAPPGDIARISDFSYRLPVDFSDESPSSEDDTPQTFNVGDSNLKVWNPNMNTDRSNHNLERVLNAVIPMENGPISWAMNRNHGEKQFDTSSEERSEYMRILPDNWDRSAREHIGQRFTPICRVETNQVSLENDEHYEYRPAYYEEVRCLRRDYENAPNNICTRLGFSCVEWNKTIHLTRRRYISNCWETVLRNVTACECMWPEHQLGSIKYHIKLHIPMEP